MPSNGLRQKGIATYSIETVSKCVKRKATDGDDKYIAPNKAKRTKKAPSEKSTKAKDSSTPVRDLRDTFIEVAHTSSNAVDPQATSVFRSLNDLPIELVYEIADHLGPADLASLCDTSVWMWRSLWNSNQNMLSIWKKSREREGVYEIPRGMNEYHWAKFFFGSRCMECGIDKVRSAAAVDFQIRRRLCNPCKKAKYMVYGYPKDQEFGEALALCPFTRLKWDGTNNCLNKFSWSDDVIEQKKMLDVLNADVRRRKKGASQKLTDYVSSRKAALKHIEAEVGHLTKLYKNYLNRLKEENSDKFRPRYEQIERNFIELGYRVGDFPPNLKMHKLVRQKAKLTERAWKSIREALEPEIQANQSEREEKEWIRLKVSRRQLVDELYAQYKFNHVPPTEWRFMPQVHHICRKPDVIALVDTDRDRTVTLADFAPCMEGLGEFLVSAFAQTKTRLRKRILEANDPFFTTDLTSTKTFRDLELAAIVFLCAACNRGVFGWDDVRSHCCNESDERLGVRVKRDDGTGRLIDEMAARNVEFPHTFKYWEFGSVAVRFVMESLGMDAKTTTTAELDSNPDLRLECWCSGESQRHCAHKWRMLAWHLTRLYHETEMRSSQRQPLKGKVPEVCIPGIILQEFEGTVSTKFDFACAHCATHLRVGKQTWYSTIKSHLRTEHAIDDPQANVDYVILMNALTEYHFFYNGTYFDHNEKPSGVISYV